jgi:hypothetical protein
MGLDSFRLESGIDRVFVYSVLILSVISGLDCLGRALSRPQVLDEGPYGQAHRVCGRPPRGSDPQELFLGPKQTSRLIFPMEDISWA